MRLASSLFGIQNSTQFDVHPFRGALFENLVVVNFLKIGFNKGKTNNLYFWFSNVGNEVNLLLYNGPAISPIEIKSGETVTQEYFKGIFYWNKSPQIAGGYVIYEDNMTQRKSNGISIIPHYP